MWIYNKIVRSGLKLVGLCDVIPSKDDCIYRCACCAQVFVISLKYYTTYSSSCCAQSSRSIRKITVHAVVPAVFMSSLLCFSVYYNVIVSSVTKLIGDKVVLGKERSVILINFWRSASNSLPRRRASLVLLHAERAAESEGTLSSLISASWRTSSILELALCCSS